MLKYFALPFIIACQLNTQAQTSSKCFTDFNFYKNEGIGLLDNCHSSYFVKCFTKANKIFKVIETNYGIAGYEEKFKVLDLKGSFIYTFSKAKMPLEGRFIRTANENRFDTLLSKDDTLYFKKAYPHDVQLSKYFKLAKDTICIVNFYYSDVSNKLKKILTFNDVTKWGSEQQYSNYTIIRLTINADSIRFVSVDSDKFAYLISKPKHLNEIVQREKVPPSLFWICIIFRFLI